MTVPVQLEVIDATAGIMSDRIITPQEADWYMQFLVFAALTIVLGSIQWSLTMDVYEESVEEVIE